ncbi:DUF4194 domain-containing protein [Carboxydothermus ferrireducens]|uniref:DUF4194 domain-containing protein n=1 Tax=Carboxydothermus ferrireducens DSM 11255 TaxID=1119529 RepID=A0ABX2RF39_9THEO|nr:DUF4194 domain-containing protein [Carboxydothermus ferrireducens]NYE58418.1 hypothetical protein [Carboxydothermus ferrireducens DSM 11255]
MEELLLIKDYSPKTREEFTRAVNKLLTQNFVIRDLEEDRKDYYFIYQHEKEVRAFLELAGWELVHFAAQRIYQAAGSSDFNKLRLNLVESLVLLILRTLYEEKRRELSLAENPLVTVFDIQERFRELGIKDKPLDKKSLRECLSLFSRYRLIILPDGAQTFPETRIVLLPTLAVVLTDKDLRAYLESLKSREAEEEADES